MQKLICLVSGGIDSPVACALMAKRFEVLPMHFCLYPYTCENAFFEVVKVLKHLRSKIGFEKAIVFPWAWALHTFLKNRRKSYACLACREGMFRVAEIFCELEGAIGIVTGESLGQKATQTLANLVATSFGRKFPVLRPLLGLDKQEIIELSRKLGLWHDTHAGCCFATPRHPCTKARLGMLEEFSADAEVRKAIRKGFKHFLEIRRFEEDFENYLTLLVQPADDDETL